MPKICLYESCSTQPIYGKKGGTKKDAEYCVKHKPEDYVNVVSKICLYESCSTQPNYGKKGGTRKDAEYCVKHKPEDYVNVVSKLCLYESCSTRPTYGKKGGTKKDAEYCVKHKPEDYIDVVNKICLYESCSTRPNYGKKGGTKKDADYCVKHKPEDYIDVVNKICLYESCSTRPTYGLLFNQKVHCSRHKKNNEYRDNIPMCEYEDCKNNAYFCSEGNYPYRCELHSKTNDMNIIERECKECGLSFMLNDISLCDDCNLWFSKNIKERKEVQIRKILERDYGACVNYDRIPLGSCNRYRPDFWWDLNRQIIILEVDENQHKSYDPDCEKARMINIVQDFGGIPVIFIRFNPDSYIDNNGYKHRGNINGRVPRLIESLKRLELHVPNVLLSIVYLYYDGFDRNNVEIIREDLSYLNI